MWIGWLITLLAMLTITETPAPMTRDLVATYIAYWQLAVRAKLAKECWSVCKYIMGIS